MGLETALLVGGMSLMAGSAVGSANQASRNRKRAEKLGRDLASLEAERDATPIVNPYENIEDLSGMISNPAANLQVGVKAAEFQRDESDISLATTLDTLRTTGAGAAGATAIAQAALRSKQGVAATIEQQEMANERLRAEGEFQAQRARMAEMQRLQQAQVMGDQFVFTIGEQRMSERMNRLAGLQAGAISARQSALAGMYGSLGALGGAAVGAAGTGTFGSGGGGGQGSDRRLKQDIEFLRLSPSGLKIYSFKYKKQEGVYEGVMSDEVPANAVIKNFIGIYDGVDYSKIDVEFKRIK